MCISFIRTALLTHKGRVETVKGEMIIPEFLLVSAVSFLPKFLRPIIAYVLGKKKQYNLEKMMRLPLIKEIKPLL